MSKIDRVQFKLPTKPSERYDDLNPLPRNVKFVNDRSGDSLEKISTKVNLQLFDNADYLNQVNSKRIDDLRTIDSMKEVVSKDKIAEYLDRESSASRIKLHQEDVANSLMNKDILLRDDELPNVSNYQTPLKIASKFKEFPNIDELSY